jgi:biofilm PGA synthesis N-glycosyltransferase PgaC
MGRHVTHTDNPFSYVLITPVRNEEAYIEQTINSVASQTRRPLRWIIVDDGSTDKTARIVGRFAQLHDWIELVQIPIHEHRDFASKVRSFNVGYGRVRNLPYAVIGNLDGDISFEPDYLEFLLSRFRDDSKLGVAGTVFREEGYRSDVDSFEGENHVAGGCQLFRRECFERIGGFVPNKCGGVDWIAVTTARMIGWKTRSFREKWFFHHRPLGGAERWAFKRAFAYGQKDYYLGGHPMWECIRSVYQMSRRPYLVGGTALGLGYLSLLLRRPARPVSSEFVKFHRSEQMAKLRAILRSLWKFNRIDPFRVTAR